jgi:cell division transport system permease protein
MKLVGASNWFVRLPYLLEGAIMSVVAVGVSFLIMYASLGALEVRAAGLIPGEVLDLSKYFYDHFWKLLAAELGATIIVNAFVMNFAVGKYLKV